MTVGLCQSPIDLSSAIEGDSGDLVIEYGESTLESRDNATTWEHFVVDGHSITYRGDAYALVQFHFHTPSEHAFDGEYAIGEIHFVHSDAEGGTVVMGVLVVESETPLSHDGNSDVMDLRDLLPRSTVHYSYNGSLTIPPFTEGVDWIILKERLPVSLEQLGRFRGRYGTNNRPIQPLNGRTVVVG
jgi:carbonic anhydrase